MCAIVPVSFVMATSNGHQHWRRHLRTHDLSSVNSCRRAFVPWSPRCERPSPTNLSQNGVCISNVAASVRNHSRSPWSPQYHHASLGALKFCMRALCHPQRTLIRSTGGPQDLPRNTARANVGSTESLVSFVGSTVPRFLSFLITVSLPARSI